MGQHKQLARLLTILAHVFELQRQYPSQPAIAQAFVAQALKAGVHASQQGGSWAQSWDMLGLVDPMSPYVPLTSPAERIAVAALVKEKAALDAVTKTSMEKDDA